VELDLNISGFVEENRHLLENYFENIFEQLPEGFYNTWTSVVLAAKTSIDATGKIGIIQGQY